MNKYQNRINCTATVVEAGIKTRGKVAFKTKSNHWLQTEGPSIALISIDSSFHEGLNGTIKMDAFLSVLKEQMGSSLSILLADTAHIHTQKLKDKSWSVDRCVQSAGALVERFSAYFEGCKLLYWSSHVSQSEYFDQAYDQVHSLYDRDESFQKLLAKDAEACYSEKRRREYLDKRLFIEKTKEDILEQSACILVLSKLGYRYQFYPGLPHASTQHVNCKLLPPEKQVNWINVFLSIEKKTTLSYSKRDEANSNKS